MTSASSKNTVSRRATSTNSSTRLATGSNSSATRPHSRLPMVLITTRSSSNWMGATLPTTSATTSTSTSGPAPTHWCRPSATTITGRARTRIWSTTSSPTTCPGTTATTTRASCGSSRGTLMPPGGRPTTPATTWSTILCSHRAAAGRMATRLRSSGPRITTRCARSAICSGSQIR